MCDEPCSYDAVFVIRYAGSIDTRHLAPVSQDTGPVQVAVVSRSRARSGDKAYMVFGIPSCVRWRCCAYFLENLRPSSARRHDNHQSQPVLAELEVSTCDSWKVIILLQMVV